VSDIKALHVNGIRLAYRRFGAPFAPTAVLLHALGETSETWQKVASTLAVDYCVYAVDLRGHGDSDRPGVYQLELMRDDVLAFLHELELAPTILIGHSMGAIVAYLAAEQKPAVVSRLVLEDPAPPLARAARELPQRPEGPLAFDWAVVALRAELNDPPAEWWDRLAEITAPTLVIGGGPTSHIPQEQLADLANHIPDGRFTTIPAGHEIHAAQPEEFLAEITAFLQR
jgi:pimeloyl-ACP methyl ester carboxylesterase